MTEAEFEHLLVWLDSDREAAARTYQSIHDQLVNHFTRKHCLPAVSEELADRTVDRAANCLLRHAVPRQNEVLPYFFRCAYFIRLEHFRERKPLDDQALNADAPDSHNPRTAVEKEIASKCLNECVQKLPADKRRTFILYYEVEKQTKVKDRAALAAQLGCSLNALRLQMLRLRQEMQVCIVECSASNGAH